jgi:hypothetical protein
MHGTRLSGISCRGWMITKSFTEFYTSHYFFHPRHGIDGIDWMTLFTLAPSNTTRGHSLKLFRKQCRTSQRLHSFSIRVIDQWNNPWLDSYKTSVKSIRECKKSLYNQPKPYFFKKLLWSHFWIDFNKCNTKTFGIVHMLIFYLLIMLLWVIFICT